MQEKENNEQESETRCENISLSVIMYLA